MRRLHGEAADDQHSALAGGARILRRAGVRRLEQSVLEHEDAAADAFDLGADDYLTKPFSFVVLTARLRALLRRGAPQRPTVLAVGDLRLDPARRTVQRGSAAITLTPREFGLLEFLMRNKDKIGRAHV